MPGADDAATAESVAATSSQGDDGTFNLTGVDVPAGGDNNGESSIGKFELPPAAGAVAPPNEEVSLRRSAGWLQGLDSAESERKLSMYARARAR